MTTRQRNQYEISLKHYWDMISDRETTRNRLKRERAAAREEGLAEGRAEGEQTKAFSIAIQMKADGMPISMIVKYTGMSEEEINSL